MALMFWTAGQTVGPENTVRSLIIHIHFESLIKIKANQMSHVWIKKEQVTLTLFWVFGCRISGWILDSTGGIYMHYYSAFSGSISCLFQKIILFNKWHFVSTLVSKIESWIRLLLSNMEFLWFLGQACVLNERVEQGSVHIFCKFFSEVKVKQSRYRLGGAQRVPVS